MIDYIYEELKSKVKIPSLTIDEIFVSKCDATIMRHCSTKQVIRLIADEVQEILKETSIPLPEFLVNFDDGMNETDTSKYENITDGYQLSEYFGKENLYIPSFDYFRAVKFGNIDCIINMYNGRTANIPFKQVTDKIKVNENTDTITMEEVVPFPAINDTIKYVKFIDTKYDHKIRIHQYPYTFPALCVNLPLEYYSTQNVPENIFCWDIDKKEYCFSNKSYKAVMRIFNDVCTSGIVTPLYFQVSQGKIVSASDEDYITLLIAKYLKIPTIPAVLYMLRNDNITKSLISMRPSDIITARTLDLDTTKKEYDMLNNICNPYFIFENNDYILLEENPDADRPDTDDYDGPIYQSMRDITDGKEVSRNEYYLINDGRDNIDHGPQISAEELHEQMKKELDKSIQESVNTALKNLEYLNTR